MNGDVSDRGPLIIIGASARAAAQSAIRAGYQPWCIDLFADRDLQAIASVKRCPGDQWPSGIIHLLHDAPPAPVLFTGAMENHLEVVRAIEHDRTILGPTIDAIIPLRNPAITAKAGHGMLISDPAIADVPSRSMMVPQPGSLSPELAQSIRNVAVLAKAKDGAGGRAVRRWQYGDHASDGEYLEEFVTGKPISGTFRVEAGKIVLATFMEQLVGDDGFGAREFQYVGNIGPLHFPYADLALSAYVERLITDPVFGNPSGVLGVDAIYTHDVGTATRDAPLTYVLEINPRFPAGAEVWERTTGRSVLNAHGIMSGSHTFEHVTGKAIVYAQQDCIVRDLYEHFNENEIADVPEVGTAFKPGEPVCTVFSQAATRDACYAGLRDQAERVYTRLQSI